MCYQRDVLAPALLEILVCPKSKQPLIYFPRGEEDADEAQGILVAPASRLRYRIEAGVPVMLVEEAVELSPEALQKLVARAKQLGFVVPAGL